MHARMHTYVRTYICMMIHTYMYTYIHTGGNVRGLMSCSRLNQPSISSVTTVKQ